MRQDITRYTAGTVLMWRKFVVCTGRGVHRVHGTPDCTQQQFADSGGGGGHCMKKFNWRKECSATYNFSRLNDDKILCFDKINRHNFENSALR
jgi:hypothetical protein